LCRSCGGQKFFVEREGKLDGISGATPGSQVFSIEFS